MAPDASQVPRHVVARSEGIDPGVNGAGQREVDHDGRRQLPS